MSAANGGAAGLQWRLDRVTTIPLDIHLAGRSFLVQPLVFFRSLMAAIDAVLLAPAARADVFFNRAGGRAQLIGAGPRLALRAVSAPPGPHVALCARQLIDDLHERFSRWLAAADRALATDLEQRALRAQVSDLRHGLPALRRAAEGFLGAAVRCPPPEVHVDLAQTLRSCARVEHCRDGVSTSQYLRAAFDTCAASDVPIAIVGTFGPRFYLVRGSRQGVHVFVDCWFPASAKPSFSGNVLHDRLDFAARLAEVFARSTYIDGTIVTG